MSYRRLSVPREMFLALALIAAAFLLLRPACELWFAHVGADAAWAYSDAVALGAPNADGSASTVQCCANVSAGDFVLPLLALTGSSQLKQGFPVATLAAVASVGATAVRKLQWLRAPPRSLRSFYVRSSRIAR